MGAIFSLRKYGFLRADCGLFHSYQYNGCFLVCLILFHIHTTSISHVKRCRVMDNKFYDGRLENKFTQAICHAKLKLNLGGHKFNKTSNVLYRNNEARSCNHCCSAKSISITYFECAFVTSGIPTCNRHAPYCHLCPAPLYGIFLHYLINSMIFEKIYIYIEHQMCVLIFSTTFAQTTAHSKMKCARYDQKSILVYP